MKNIRNFSIIAHIDHGKSTLSDRIIQHCGGLSEREMHAQILDTMSIERDRGITIKSQSVTLNYTAKNNETYELNFIDTPGHVDFSYEVSRSLSACEGALLVVDASQGVEAQTLANCYKAIDLGLEIIPVLNKVDLPAANPERVKLEIKEVIGINAENAPLVSAKTGFNIEQVLETIVATVPPPNTDKSGKLKALIIDSWFDKYLGVVSLVRVFSGQLQRKQKIKVFSNKGVYQVEELGYFSPKKHTRDAIIAGQVGYCVAAIKDIDAAPVGDTITDAKNPAANSLPGFKIIQPRVFAGLFPVNNDEYESLRESLEKLKLNDASLFYEPENSVALGFGFRCGFLGLLHMEIIQERLEREYDLNLITTSPTVIYKIMTKNQKELMIDNPTKLPDKSLLENIQEPIIQANILVPQDYLGAVIQLCVEKRGVQKNMQYHGRQVQITYDLPLNEVVIDFYDRLKSSTRGYASMDYEFMRFEESKLAKVDILINGEKVDALALITHENNAVKRGKALIEKLKEVIPRQMYEVAIQASIGVKIIARVNVKALRKNVTAKCYGGDVSRKKKLLQKQKEGKKRMKSIGKIDLPQEAFLAILNLKNN